MAGFGVLISKNINLKYWHACIATIDANLERNPKTILRKYFIEDKAKALIEIEKLKK